MRTLGVLLHKELLATFGSPIAYTVAAVFLLVLGYTFSLTLFATKVANLLYIFHQMYVLTILLVPALTMRAIAEERRTDTLELLLTAPVGEVWIVLAKFLSVLALVLAINLSLIGHFRPMVTGSVFVSDIGYFVTAALLALFLTTRRLAER